MRIDCTCRHCGRLFTIRRRPGPNGVGQYCSKQCSGLAQAHPRRPLAERFWEKVTKTDGCWLWIAARQASGHGVINEGGRGPRRMAHRVAWELLAGPVPDGLDVLHACDVPHCVRADTEGYYAVNGILRPRRGHLFLGTQQDNMADMVAKMRHAYGEQSSSAILTAAEVLAIRREASGGLTHQAIADRHALSRQHVTDIVSRRRWKYVE